MAELRLFRATPLPEHMKEYDVQAIADILNSDPLITAAIRPKRKNVPWTIDIKLLCTEDNSDTADT